MKIFIPAIFIMLCVACSVKKEKRTIVAGENSISKNELKNTAPTDLDTLYVEDPVTGDIQMILTKKGRQATRKANTIRETKFPKHKKGDTVYVEDPTTGNINMIIVK